VGLTGRQKITIAVSSLYFITLVVSTHIPIPKIVYKAEVSDKWLHFPASSNYLMRIALMSDSGIFFGKGGIKRVANQHHLPGAKRLCAVECLDETFAFD
jgi:hypothetical protein